MSKGIFEQFVNNNYSLIKAKAHSKAYNFKVNADDFLSSLNMKISSVIFKGQFKGDTELDCLKYLSVIIHTSMLDFKKMVYTKGCYREMPLESFRCVLDGSEDNGQLNNTGYHINSVYQPDFELRDFVNKIFKMLAEIKNKKYSKIFITYMTTGKSYDEIAETMRLPLSTIKSGINRVRQLITQQFGNAYLELLA